MQTLRVVTHSSWGGKTKEVQSSYCSLMMESQNFSRNQIKFSRSKKQSFHSVSIPKKVSFPALTNEVFAKTVNQWSFLVLSEKTTSRSFRKTRGKHLQFQEFQVQRELCY